MRWLERLHRRLDHAVAEPPADHLDDELARQPALEHVLDGEPGARERRARRALDDREPRERTSAIRCAACAASRG